MANPRYDRLSFHLLAGVFAHVLGQLRPRHVEVYPIAAGVRRCDARGHLACLAPRAALLLPRDAAAE
jgi:hypothetical protein